LGQALWQASNLAGFNRLERIGSATGNRYSKFLHTEGLYSGPRKPTGSARVQHVEAPESLPGRSLTLLLIARFWTNWTNERRVVSSLLDQGQTFHNPGKGRVADDPFSDLRVVAAIESQGAESPAPYFRKPLVEFSSTSDWNSPAGFVGTDVRWPEELAAWMRLGPPGQFLRWARARRRELRT